MAKKLVIIGGNGFIGLNAVAHFQNAYEVYAIDKNPTPAHPPSISYLNINIRDRETLRSNLLKINPMFVLHLASKSTVSACHQEPEEAYLDNVLGTLNVLSSCQILTSLPNAAFKKLLVHTSDKVYGEHPEETLPYLETYPHYRADVYSTSKAAQDMMTLCWSSQYNLPFCTIRSGNIYGPGDLNFSRLIPQTVQRLLKGENPLIYKGNEKAKRDFVYIQDLLSAYEHVFRNGRNGESYNVGGGKPIMVCEVIDRIKEAMQLQHKETLMMERDLPELKAQYLNSQKLRNLGWIPKTPLTKGIESCIEFYRGSL